MVGKRGAKLKPATTRDNPPNGVKTLDGGFMTPFGLRSTSWHFYGATMGDLARFLSTAGRPVRDKTGLTGRYELLPTGTDPRSHAPESRYGVQVAGRSSRARLKPVKRCDRNSSSTTSKSLAQTDAYPGVRCESCSSSVRILGDQWTSVDHPKKPVSYFWKSSCKVALSETCRDEPDWRSRQVR